MSNSTTLVAGVRQWFERTEYSGDLTFKVAMKVTDLTSGAPVLIETIPMIVGDTIGTYIASFIPEEGKSYLVTTAVYTDTSYTVRDDMYAGTSNTFYATAQGGGVVSNCECPVDLTGEIQLDFELTGQITQLVQLTGTIEVVETLEC